MSTSNFSLSEFQAQVLGRGLAKTNRFEILIQNPPSFTTIGALKENLTTNQARTVSLLCENVSFPPLNVLTKPLKIFGPAYQRPYTSEYGGDGLSVQFHVDSDMTVKRFFDDWMESIISNTSFTVAYQNEYATNIYIRQLNEQDQVTYEIELIEAFPRNMNIMELSNSSQNQTHRLNVIFAYRYWRRTDIPSNLQQTTLTPLSSEIQLPEPPFSNYTFIGNQDEFGNISDISGP